MEALPDHILYDMNHYDMLFIEKIDMTHIIWVIPFEQLHRQALPDDFHHYLVPCYDFMFLKKTKIVIMT